MTTIADIEAEHSRLSTLIAELKTQQLITKMLLPSSTIELCSGEHYAGLILSEDGLPQHHLILLPGELASTDHPDATAWAASIGGDLPTRAEQSLLYANLKAHFKSAAYWSKETYKESSAWYQGFSDGYQCSNHQYPRLRARAVRRLVL